jgi:hypothetical protein
VCVCVCVCMSVCVDIKRCMRMSACGRVMLVCSCKSKQARINSTPSQTTLEKLDLRLIPFTHFFLNTIAEITREEALKLSYQLEPETSQELPLPPRSLDMAAAPGSTAKANYILLLLSFSFLEKKNPAPGASSISLRRLFCVLSKSSCFTVCRAPRRTRSMTQTKRAGKRRRSLRCRWRAHRRSRCAKIASKRGRCWTTLAPSASRPASRTRTHTSAR